MSYHRNIQDKIDKLSKTPGTIMEDEVHWLLGTVRSLNSSQRVETLKYKSLAWGGAILVLSICILVGLGMWQSSEQEKLATQLKIEQRVTEKERGYLNLQDGIERQRRALQAEDVRLRKDWTERERKVNQKEAALNEKAAKFTADQAARSSSILSDQAKLKAAQESFTKQRESLCTIKHQAQQIVNSFETACQPVSGKQAPRKGSPAKAPNRKRVGLPMGL